MLRREKGGPLIHKEQKCGTNEGREEVRSKERIFPPSLKF